MALQQDASVTAGPLSTKPCSQAGTRALICVDAPLDLEGTHRLLDRIRPLCASSQCLVLDLQRAEYIDSAGIRALLKLADDLETRGKALHLVVEPESRVERTLELLELRERLHASPTLEAAWEIS